MNRSSMGNRGEAGELTTLIDALVADQRRLTAVERFAEHHDAQDGPVFAEHYRELIPLSTPRPGEQYAFEVDLDRCSGCKACVTACHSLNGLDEEESWREVGLLVGSQPLQQTVTTACHHCVEPACLLGCPVLAYDKDLTTGIVRHLDDQCIGCSYCLLTCPYEVPKYSAKRGIVRKCDMCHGRLADGEAPACVQACPNEAIKITLVSMEALRARFRADSRTSAKPRWLPDAPHPAITLPATRYLSRRADALRAADHADPQPQPAHWPLVIMLVLTQAGIGTLSASLFLQEDVSAADSLLVPGLATVGFALFVAGLAASIFHLGQPLKAWRVWLGWRTRWLSREAVVLNAFGGIATLVLGVWWARSAANGLSQPNAWTSLIWKAGELSPWLCSTPLLFTGVTALWAQTKVYGETGRQFWRVATTGPRFMGTALVVGSAATLAVQPSATLAGMLASLVVLKLVLEISVLKHANTDAEQWTPLRRTAVLQLGPLRPLLGLRLLCAISGGLLVPFLLTVGALSQRWAVGAAVVLLAGEFAERWLFFTSVAPQKMPGLQS